MNAVREIIPQIQWETNEVPNHLIMSLEVQMEHFNAAMHEVEPSAMRDIIIEIPDTTFADIGGLSEAKRVLEETVSWRLIHSDLFALGRVKPARGILLAGPPGTGKTLLARALAHESAAIFFLSKDRHCSPSGSVNRKKASGSFLKLARWRRRLSLSTKSIRLPQHAVHTQATPVFPSVSWVSFSPSSTAFRT